MKLELESQVFVAMLNLVKKNGRSEAMGRVTTESLERLVRPILFYNSPPVVQYRFHNTRHSIAREGVRELSSEDVKAVVRSPDHRVRLRSGQHRGTVFSFEKSVEGTILKVIPEVRDQDVWIITAYEKS